MAKLVQLTVYKHSVHIGVWAKNSARYRLRQWMEKRGQLHAAAALHLLSYLNK